MYTTIFQFKQHSSGGELIFLIVWKQAFPTCCVPFTIIFIVSLVNQISACKPCLIYYINAGTVCVCVCVCVSVCLSPHKVSGTERCTAVLFRRHKEILLVSCTNCFSNLYDTWFERKSVWNFSAGYALEPVHARYTSNLRF